MTADPMPDDDYRQLRRTLHRETDRRAREHNASLYAGIDPDPETEAAFLALTGGQVDDGNGRGPWPFPDAGQDVDQWDDPDLEPADRFMGRIVSGDSLLNLPTPDPMVGTWLDRGMLAQLVGPYGSAKTFVALELGLSVSSGRAWLGQPIHHQGQVLYVAAEGGYTFPDRARGWMEDTGRALPADFLVYPHRFDITDSGIVDHPGLWTPLRAALDSQHITPSLVILDTRSRLAPGNENDSETSARLLKACDLMRDLVPNLTIVVIHHPGHNATGRGRGHSSFEDNLDVVWSLTGRLKDGPVKLTDEKQKARAQNEQGMWLTLTTTESGFPRLVTTGEPIDDEEDGRAIRARILATVQAHPGRCTLSDLFKRDSPFYVGGRPKVEQTVKLLLANNEISAREHRHEDTDRTATRLFPGRSLLHDNTEDMQ